MSTVRCSSDTGPLKKIDTILLGIMKMRAKVGETTPLLGLIYQCSWGYMYVPHWLSFTICGDGSQASLSPLIAMVTTGRAGAVDKPSVEQWVSVSAIVPSGQRTGSLRAFGLDYHSILFNGRFRSHDINYERHKAWALRSMWTTTCYTPSKTPLGDILSPSAKQPL